MKCEICHQEIEGRYIKYKDHFFCRQDNDQCFKEWLYDQTDGSDDIEYGPIAAGEKEPLPEWSEEYLNTLGMGLRDFF